MHLIYVCWNLFCPPAETSQEGQDKSAEASRARKPGHTTAKHRKDRQAQHQEGSLHHYMFLGETDQSMINM